MSGPANGLYRSMGCQQPQQPQPQQQPPPPSSGLPSNSFYGSGSVAPSSQSSSLFSHTSAAPPSTSLGFTNTGGSLGVGLGSALGAFGSSGLLQHLHLHPLVTVKLKKCVRSTPFYVPVWLECWLNRHLPQYVLDHVSKLKVHGPKLARHLMWPGK